MSKIMMPGEWQVDKDGNRFRMIGQGCVEYEPELVTTHGSIHADSYTVKTVTPKEEKKKPDKYCPFQRGIPCREDCALWNGNGCGIGTGAQESKGRCPFSSLICGRDCGLFRGGRCGLLEIG